MSRARWTVLAAPVLALVLAACGSGTTSTPSVSSAARQKSEVEQIAADYNQHFGISGYLVGVWQPQTEEILVESGTAHRDDHWRIASVTKSLVGVAVLKLVQTGQLSLDQKLGEFVPGITNGDRITIRQLLNMTAGVDEMFDEQSMLGQYLDDPNQPWTVADSIEYLRGKPAEFPPGSQVKYDNSNYILLGEVIRKAANRPANEVVTDLVIKPHGLQETSIPLDSGLPSPAVPGVMVRNGSQQNVDLQNPALPYTAGDAISTIDDLRVFSVQLAKGTMLPANLQEQLMQFAPMGDLKYGLGVIDMGGWIGHTGGIPGYVCTVFTDPATDRTVVTMSAGGEFDNPAAQAVFVNTVATLWPGQYPFMDKTAAQLQQALRSKQASGSPSPS